MYDHKSGRPKHEPAKWFNITLTDIEEIGLENKGGHRFTEYTVKLLTFDFVWPLVHYSNMTYTTEID